MLHRINGPSTIIFNNNRLAREYYYRNNLLHRDNDPACITYNDNGQIGVERWYRNGKLHRGDDLPAEINNIENSVSYFIDGKEYTPRKILNANKANSIIHLFIQLYTIRFIMSKYDGDFEGYFAVSFLLLIITTPVRLFFENVFDISNTIVKLWDLTKSIKDKYVRLC